ncbi:voltage-dependent T-type calcium channel subunit alpha-1G isoform X3 [Nilaparvata lugens]|uniref:voltage-dependent T-type calcium channel subunit alpha-1G isoform X3 n=1 Tax=Nilaparvata lugens TaxID=108931 RepID=UPI00193C91C0|nr:voltage-dependent T-type calcium channel subunit alpha-1G isoform X3 [Nilaparvata lugens]
MSQNFRYSARRCVVDAPSPSAALGDDSDLVAALSDLEDDDEDEEEEEDDDEEEAEEEEDEDLDEEEGEDDDLPYPGFVAISLKYLDQKSKPRNWCLAMITSPWFERVSMLVILLNCVTLGMYQPCVDDQCLSNRCKILQMFDDFIFVFFALEMSVKMIAMGVYGRGTYLADSWNRLDFFIVVAGALEYCLNIENMNLTAIRTIRVLRPLRAINRIPSMRILVMLLLDTLPMLGNVLLLCFFVFFIFGIVGVQLWEGILRQRCFLKPIPNVTYPKEIQEEFVIRARVTEPLAAYYQYQEQDRDYICSKPEDNGMHTCGELPPYKHGDLVCNNSALPWSNNIPNDTHCVNWNQYYTECKPQGHNPFQGTISFDNIGLAWVAIFLVISLEGWSDIMYYVQDAHSFWDWIYFVLLIVIGSFFMINLCLVVIATQFSETKKREMERMRLERARFQSTSTLASSTNNSEPTTCYAEIVKYVAHLWRRGKRRLAKKWRLFKYRRQQKKELKNSNKDGGTSEGVNNNGNGGNLEANVNLGSSLLLHAFQQDDEEGKKQGNDSLANSPLGTPCTPRCIVGSDNEEPMADESPASPKRSALLRVPSFNNGIHRDPMDMSGSQLLSPPGTNAMSRRRSSVMFSDVVLLHGAAGCQQQTRNICSSEKMTQAGDGTIWPTDAGPDAGTDASLLSGAASHQAATVAAGEAMTCQELLALSGALSAALPTGQLALDSLFSSLSKGVLGAHLSHSHYQDTRAQMEQIQQEWAAEKSGCGVRCGSGCCATCLCGIRNCIKALVEHKYFQQGILLAILINTFSMGIEYHNQPEELTVIVEISNIVFSAIFAFEMLLKIIAEGPFGYISNGFNVFDGIIVVLSVIELIQEYLGEGGGEGSSGLSVLRTFRLLRILKLVRFMPNLRRQLVVMLRTMDNVAVFFSLLILFIFIFSILGMYLFGGKFCMLSDGTRECNCVEIVTKHPQCVCDRKHFNNVLWATVTVFQILTQEDWNVVLFNGMEKTSHWAALYFVALMTFGNYVLFNLLVAILVEGFSSERNERREREARELARQQEQMRRKCSECICSAEFSSSCSNSESDSFAQDLKNEWSDTEGIRKMKKDNGHREKENSWKRRQRMNRAECEVKCNIQKESQMLGMHQQQPQQLSVPVVISQQPGAAVGGGGGQVAAVGGGGAQGTAPIITHTAATPQDSPSTTANRHHDREFNNRMIMPLCSSTLSIDSIDCSMSSQGSIPGLLRPPQMTVNNLSSPNSQPNYTLGVGPGPGRRISLTAQASNNGQSTIKRDSNPNVPCRFPRGSWKLSRPSRRKSRTPSEPDEDQDIVLNNNNNNHLLTSPMHLSDHSHCNGGLLGTIRNPLDRPSQQNNRLCPQSRTALSQGNCPMPQVAWVGGGGGGGGGTSSGGGSSLSRQNSMGGVSTCSSLGHNQQQALIPPSSQPPPLIVKQQALIPPNSQPPPLIVKQQPVAAPGIPPPPRVLPSRRDSALVVNMDNLSKPVNKLSDGAAPHSPLPKVKRIKPDLSERRESCIVHQSIQESEHNSPEPPQKIFLFFEPKGVLKERDDFSLYLFPIDSPFRLACEKFVTQKWFDNAVLLFIGLNCITLAMERPNIPPDSRERLFLATANYIFTVVFAAEMFVKVVAAGMFYGKEAYFTSGWNIMDGSLVIISIIDLLMSLVSSNSPRIFGILRVFRLLRSLRPLRVINRAPGLKLVVQTLLSSLRPIGNIVLICCTFFIIFGILGVQLFKGTFFYCEGPNIKNVRNRTDCLADRRNVWINRKYNFDDLGKALMSLFVLSSRDGWVNIMYTGLDAVGVDQQPIENYSEWRLLYFISFILLVGFFVLNMFVGVVVENFHRCREEQEKEERVRRMAKRAKQMEKKRRKMHEPPYYTNYCKSRLFVHNVVTSKYFDLAIAAVIGLNVITMALEFYMMPKALTYALKIFNYFFTAVFILESIMKLVALGIHLYLKDRWNLLDICIVILSIVGIALEEVESKIIPINPTIIRVMRVLRIARVLKLLKMAKGIRALLDTVMQALPQVGNLGLLFFLLFFIFAALGVELFGRLECSEEQPCQGLGEHAHFSNFGMAFLTLFRVATGDNWNGIMKDTLRDDCDDQADCVRNCCVHAGIAPIFFVIFVLMAQFVLVNVVVAVLMKHLEESHKQMEDELDMEVELEREMAAEEEEEFCIQMALEQDAIHRPLAKVLSLPANFTFSNTSELSPKAKKRRASINSWSRAREEAFAKNNKRRQTLQGPALIPPAYPATGYTTVYTTAHDKDNIASNNRHHSFGDKRHMPVRRVSSDGNRDPLVAHRASLLAVPGLHPTSGVGSDVGSCRQLDLSLTSPADTTAAAMSDDISPECVSPAVLLVPPPYPEASDEVSSTSKSDQGIQITVVEDTTEDDKQPQSQPQPQTADSRSGQRVRIRLCDTRLDSGIGDDKHSQESQPSSSGACDEHGLADDKHSHPCHVPPCDVIPPIDSHQVVVQVQHSAADMS